MPNCLLQPLSHPRSARLTDRRQKFCLCFVILGAKSGGSPCTGSRKKCNYYVLNRLVGSDIGLCIENHSEHYERIDEVDNTIAIHIAVGKHLIGKLLKLHDGTH